MLGARTNLYGEPLDVSAAICGRVPASRLHLTEERAASVVFDLGGLEPELLADDAVYQLLGYLIGSEAQTSIAAIVGLPASVSEEQLAALVSAGASSGSVELLHAVGVTPEAPTLEAALQGHPADRVVEVTAFAACPRTPSAVDGHGRRATRRDLRRRTAHVTARGPRARDAARRSGDRSVDPLLRGYVPLHRR